MIVWHLEESRAIKMRVASIESIRCLDTPIAAGTKEAFQTFLTSRRQGVKLRIERQNNAVERSFMMFANYDKEASYDEETDTYTIQFYYYDFDRHEVLRQILSLAVPPPSWNPPTCARPSSNACGQHGSTFSKIQDNIT